MKWFVKIEFFKHRRTERFRCKLLEALFVLGGLPLSEWRHIRSFTIERIN